MPFYTKQQYIDLIIEAFRDNGVNIDEKGCREELQTMTMPELIKEYSLFNV